MNLDKEIREALEKWLDDAMSTSSLGWSPFDGYKGQEENSEAVAKHDYDRYLNQATTQILKAVERDETPTHIMGRPIDEVCEILAMLDMERLAEMNLTMANLKKWQKILADEQKSMFDRAFKQLSEEK